ncbi:hypothetical protein GCM10007418_04160 [Halopseudomonas salina]|uniref:Uncharacterized protein n=1 Tax=Halopseudomonas salina TaxID=1323744 RepID=A0ABQ1NYG4_9GAMM|nr:hypothetical protein [Halopseudomonas salina]GGC87570.1 hypothetical protein GCM10007418_04160 [Halopseudomonas salina]
MLTKYKLLLQIGVALAVLVVIAAVAWWIISPRIELETQRADRAESDLAKEKELTEVQALVLEGQQREIDRAADIDRSIKLLEQTITRQATRQERAIQELKRNDQTIMDYLAEPVPADLGMLYARPDTTDPTAYRAAQPVQPGAVPATGEAAAGGE